MNKITRLTGPNIDAIADIARVRELFSEVTLTTATLREDVTPAEAAAIIGSVARALGRGHPGGSLHAVRRKVAALADNTGAANR